MEVLIGFKSPEAVKSVFIIVLASFKAFSDILTFFSEAVLKPRKAGGLFGISVGSTLNDSRDSSRLLSKALLSLKPADSRFIIALASLKDFSDMLTFLSEAVLKQTNAGGSLTGFTLD